MRVLRRVCLNSGRFVHGRVSRHVSSDVRETESWLIGIAGMWLFEPSDVWLWLRGFLNRCFAMCFY